MDYIIGIAILSLIIRYFTDKSPNKTEAYIDLDRAVVKLNEENQRFNVDAKYTDRTTGIALDAKGEKILISTNNGSRCYGYADLTGAEVVIDGNEASSANLGGAAVGGLLFGGAGAVVGAMAKGKRLRSVVLKLYFSDVQNPACHIHFLKKALKTDRFLPVVKNALKDVNDWYGRMTSILKATSRVNNAPLSSIADEIAKFAKLRDDKCISEQEFLDAKFRLLASNS